MVITLALMRGYTDAISTALVDEMVRLSREYGVMTEFTAFLATETDEEGVPQALRMSQSAAVERAKADQDLLLAHLAELTAQARQVGRVLDDQAVAFLVNPVLEPQDLRPADVAESFDHPSSVCCDGKFRKHGFPPSRE